MSETQVLSAIGALDTRVGELDTRVAGLDTRVAGLDTRVAGLDTRVAGLDTRVAGLDTRVAGLDTRLSRVEGVLPTLATREELRAEIAKAIAPLVTRDEFDAGLASLRTDLRGEIADEGEKSRRHAQVLFESLKDDMRMILDYLFTLSARVDQLARR